ncbi:STAS domain-containing protein [Trichothermofontia sp.]
MTSLIHLIQPSGILNGSIGSQIREEVTAVIGQGVDAILVDLSQVTFVDSSGLGALVACLKLARTARCQLAICGLNDQVKMLLELTSMDRVFSIFPNRVAFEAAIEEAKFPDVQIVESCS